MLLTFFYVIATSIQSRRILFLKTHLRNFFQGSTNGYPSIMFYNETPIESCKDSKTSVESEYDTTEKFTTSSLCSNKNDARLGELLWFREDMRLCTIYPQQKVDVSDWLMYQQGRTYFPLYSNNRGQTVLQPEYKIHVLVEADLDSYQPSSETHATKIEDYGLIVTWTARKNIGLIIESDLDTVTKFLIAAMQGDCHINNGLLLKRVETVLVSGKPCLYNNDLLNPPSDNKKAEWEAHVENLKLLSSTARMATEQQMPMEVLEFPGVTVYPENTATEEQIELLGRAASSETLDSTRSHISIPASLNLPQQDDKLSEISTQSVIDEAVSLENLSNAGSKSTEKLDSVEVEETKETETEVREEIERVESSSEPSNVCKDEEKKSTSKSSTESSEKFPSRSPKPPNVLIYADSAIALNNVKAVLEESLGSHKYAIYALTLEEARTDVWMENAVLVVACGNVGGEIGSQFVEYIFRGGKLLALCSDVLHILLPFFKTAEVRENELVCFSYGKWKHVRMMHHIFCYQASPIRTRFSQENDDVKVSSLHPPTTANVKDKKGKVHSFDVRVLGTEETWHTPSILLASLPGSGGKVVFSQIHLEVDPMQYELEESKFNALKESNASRLEIFNDLLEVHLGVELMDEEIVPATYTPAFFLGRHELKLEMLERMKDLMQSNDVLKVGKLNVQFCRGNAKVKPASNTFLPIMVHQCPDNFSTIEYFENLRSRELGRLVIYADTMTSTMDVLSSYRLQHGLAVITRQQTQGRGRGRNIWLSPRGCAMFSLQLHVPTDSPVGNQISILQQLFAVAIVSAVKTIPGYEEIDLKVKWPNDIYANNKVKIGGILVKTLIESSSIICNAGCGVNLSNKEPTVSINELISSYNQTKRKDIKLITFEQYFALVFNQIESLLDSMQAGNADAFFDAFYKHWMHTDAEVTVVDVSGKSQQVKILGIDNYGFLRVRGDDGNVFTVHPDGNSFDPLKGLIAPKY